MNTRNENTDCLWKMNWYKKGERAVIPKMMYSEFQGGGGGGGGRFVTDNSVCITG